MAMARGRTRCKMGPEPVPATWFQMSEAPGSAAWPRSDDGALEGAVVA
jgi:hypothetical protein